ncbi:MAG TPA: glycoside hydrolase family 44 protein [Gemmataceae bacterium]|nr:glycoside hydrolase family 44 protein [Gemmataceae bacterium]
MKLNGHARRRQESTAGSSRLRLERLETRALPAVTIAVNAALDQHAISPMIYGTAFASTAQLQDLNSPYNRSGGNAETRYNWQINASNHAADWYFESIASSTGGSAPSGEADNFISTTKAAGAQPTITIPTIGWVAKLGSNRNINVGSFQQQTYPSQQAWDPYWSPTNSPIRPGNGVLPSGQNITGNDPNVANQPATPAFQQGWIQHLVSTFGNANSGGVQYYTLDNEPSIWQSSHRDVHPVGATMAEIRDDIINYSAMIKSVDPNALVVGPEEWGWSGYLYSGYDQQYAAAHNYNGVYPDRQANGNMDYLPWVLNQLHIYDQAHGTKSLDVFSAHYYPQESGVFGNAVDPTTATLRNQSTRSLWDPTFTDPSWINAQVNLIPRLQGWVNQYYPGLKTDLSEYNFGAEGNMNGATAQADVFGIFGRQGLDMANRWTTPATGSPTYLAMKMYRNYDGSDSTFGQTNVRATVPNPDQVSAFASLRSDGALTVMVVNKNLYSSSSPTTAITLNLANFAHGSSAQLWQLAATNPTNQNNAAISHLANVSFSGDTLSLNAPDESVSLFVIPAGTTTGLTSSANPAAVGTPVTFTASVGSAYGVPGGTVTFMDGTSMLGTASLTGGVAMYTTSSLALGSHNITAVYGGTPGFAGSTSPAVNQVIATPTTVGSVQVNDGSAQRSEFRSIAVTFSTAVSFANGNAAAAFQLTHVQDGVNVNNLVAAVSTNGAGQTIVTLTFTAAGNAATEVDPVSALNGGAASLADGRYQLTINAGLITGAQGLLLDGDNNGTGGGNYVSPNDTFQGAGLHLYRLFGDVNGDGVVDATDLGLFRSAFNTSTGNPLYLSYLDADNSGAIDAQDLGQFRTRFNVNVF